jgi:hypothetical protein
LEYDQHDFEVLFAKIDLTEDGLISRTELRAFLEQLALMKPPLDLLLYDTNKKQAYQEIELVD